MHFFNRKISLTSPGIFSKLIPVFFGDHVVIFKTEGVYNMLRVGVCDDERIPAERLAVSLREIFEQKGVDAGISLFLSGKALLDAATKMDLVFLDIDMPEMDGITTGKELRHRNSQCSIVMVSAMETRMKEGYFVGACRFVSKPVSTSELTEAVDAVLKRSPGADLIRLFLDNHSYDVPQNRIDYAEAYNGYTIFHVGGRLFRREENLSYFDSVLDPRLFVRASRKYIVNLGNVSRANSAAELCFREEHIQVARRQRGFVHRKYIEYDLSYGGSSFSRSTP